MCAAGWLIADEPVLLVVAVALAPNGGRDPTRTTLKIGQSLLALLARHAGHTQWILPMEGKHHETHHPPPNCPRCPRRKFLLACGHEPAAALATAVPHQDHTPWSTVVVSVAVAAELVVESNALEAWHVWPGAEMVVVVVVVAVALGVVVASPCDVCLHCLPCLHLPCFGLEVVARIWRKVFIGGGNSELRITPKSPCKAHDGCARAPGPAGVRTVDAPRRRFGCIPSVKSSKVTEFNHACSKGDIGLEAPTTTPCRTSSHHL